MLLSEQPDNYGYYDAYYQHCSNRKVKFKIWFVNNYITGKFTDWKFGKQRPEQSG